MQQNLVKSILVMLQELFLLGATPSHTLWALPFLEGKLPSGKGEKRVHSYRLKQQNARILKGFNHPFSSFLSFGGLNITGFKK